MFILLLTLSRGQRFSSLTMVSRLGALTHGSVLVHEVDHGQSGHKYTCPNKVSLNERPPHMNELGLWSVGREKTFSHWIQISGFQGADSKAWWQYFSANTSGTGQLSVEPAAGWLTVQPKAEAVRVEPCAHSCPALYSTKSSLIGNSPSSFSWYTSSPLPARV